MSRRRGLRSSVRRKAAVAVLAALATLVFARAAYAYHEGDERIVDATAHTLRAGELRVGLWELELGTFDFVTIGTDTAPWAASFVVDSVVENGHVKLRLLRTAPLTISVAAAVYHTSLSGTGRLVSGNGSLLLVPITAFASSDLSSSFSLHLGATYAHLDAPDLSLDVGNARAQTAIAATAVQLHAMGEWRASRVVALTLQVHGQAYATPATVHITSTDSLGEQVGFAGTVAPKDRTAVSAVASVAFSGRHFNARLGAGYGAIFLPSMGVTVPISTIIPEVDVYVRF
jgi:hypothetical protein